MQHLNRVIPVLTVLDGKLVKTKQFKDPVYLGDPINAIKIFNDKRVDELILLDIGLAKANKEPNYQHLKEMASECFIPLAYGGGITQLHIAEKVFKCGIEKVIINTACVNNFKLVSEIARAFGNQSVIVCIDYKKNMLGTRVPYVNSGTNKIKQVIQQWISTAEAAGAGEIMIQDISRDGTFLGLDLDFISAVSAKASIPVIACGGARDKEACIKALQETNASAVAAGGCFVFKKNNRKSILINYQ